MIHLDTNYLIASLTPSTVESRHVAQWLGAGEIVGLSVIAWAEFLCGPVTPQQMALATASGSLAKVRAASSSSSLMR